MCPPHSDFRGVAPPNSRQPGPFAATTAQPCNKACFVTADNTVKRIPSIGEVLSEDEISFQSTDGSNPGRVVSLKRFIFSCAPTSLREDLARGGLGRFGIAFPSQFASAFSFSRKFALCLSSSAITNGVVFFGDGPYHLLPDVDASRSLTYTPLYINPSARPPVTPGGSRLLNTSSK